MAQTRPAHTRYLTLLGFSILWLLVTSSANAATSYVVTNCTAQGLVDAMNTFNNTLVQDGIITFNCNNAHAAATINISYPGGYGVATGAAYTMDGGGIITLTGGNDNRVLNLQKNAALTLTNISVINGNAGADYGGCIFNFSAKLRLDNVTLQNCRTADGYQGGAIYNNGGTLTVSGSRILSGTASYGGGIFSVGTLTILGSTIAYNTATTGAGGGVHATGNATISNSQLSFNRALGGDGGGLYVESGSRVSIDNSLLASNVTTNTQFASGGGLYSLGSVTVTNSTLSSNLARYGGGMDSEGTALLNNTTLSGNHGTTTGGGVFNAGNMTVSNSTLSGNQGDLSAGGIDNQGTLTLTHSTLNGNQAYGSGGGITNESSRMATIDNSTLSGNTATNNGGALYNNGSTTFVNATIANNSATAGGALYMLSGKSTVLNNTIVAYSASGGNCFGNITSSKFTLSSDNTCALPAGNTIKGMNPNNLDPLLTALGDYGGPTLVHMPKANSPAVDGIVGNDAPSVDQRGEPRPQMGGYDIGAVERQASDSDGVTPTTAQFSSASYNVGEGAGFATINVTRTGDTSGTVTVDYQTSDISAEQRTDYTIGAGTVTFGPGDTSKSFVVLIVNDLYVEGSEVLNLTLSNPTGGATLVSPSVATLTIVDNDSLSPTTNPLDDARFFVQQHYYDFLSRYPDTSGWDFWTGQITQCGTDATCLHNKRIDVSNAYFYELEYQQTGAFVFRLYRAAFGNSQPFPNPDQSNPTEAYKLPAYAKFAFDRARVVGGSSLAQGQLDFANAFVQRPEFLAKYPANLDGSSFIDAVLNTIKNDLGVDLTAQKPGLLTLFNSGGRGAVMYRLADDNVSTNPINNRAFIDEEYNRAFVATQYFGYLRRDADIGGFLFWLGQVSSAPLRDVTKQHAMVCAFITSAEYQQRFSSVVTHHNAECSQ